MSNPFIWSVICFLALILILVVIHTVVWNKKIKNIEEEFNLIEGCLYNIITNSGKTYKNLVYIEIYKGKKSANGSINLLFKKETQYRNETVYRDFVVKYETIWKVIKLD